MENYRFLLPALRWFTAKSEPLADFAIFLVCLNVWHHNSRAHMTQAERDEEDETAERW
jgi:hypothetical protein